MATFVIGRKRASEGDVPLAKHSPTDYTRCTGMRLFLDGHCMHQSMHNEQWQRALQVGVEAGTVRSVDQLRRRVEVTWDCGATCTYSADKGELEKLRILDCASTGMLFLPGLTMHSCLYI